ncbi:hypothetical protein MIND_00107000 [Mycena indigotica]|uniref:HAD-like protein n=1 Tax=Mycena indigotica TaxID=2126181 RepID=A0A8H6TER2_9AGAR|nr:uncharacterized protein MIND_00107000 [Mycena indigotica]KAF7315904.1 hypothetical protein MIND_00107000 [Mycena indigotica]
MCCLIWTASLAYHIKINVIDVFPGLLLDTESIYTKVTNTILAPYGKEMTWDIKAGCMGKPELPAAQHLLSCFPDLPKSFTAESYLIERNRLQDTFWHTTQFLPGAKRLLLHLAKHHVPIAVATSSKRRNYELKTNHLADIFGRDGVFATGERKMNVVCGDDRAVNGEPIAGKPAPDIFLTAARDKLGRDVGFGENPVVESQVVERAQGLVFEDALPGVQAGKRAGMNVIWVPDPNLLALSNGEKEPNALQPDRVIHSLEEFVPEDWGLPAYDEV